MTELNHIMVRKTSFYDGNKWLHTECMNGWQRAFKSPLFDERSIDNMVAETVEDSVRQYYQWLLNLDISDLSESEDEFDENDYEDHVYAWQVVLSCIEKYPKSVIRLG
jgi:hypothetical protein